ncbi:hypothetical protein DVS77_02290 [Mycolicibacterium moriokaense]|nr:hypothetical protein DVS77_02290 [Mycolicibacterium moriokaense]
MDIRRRRITSGVKAIALLVVSITITTAVMVAMLVDTLTAPRLASAPQDCALAVHPVVNTLDFVEGRC